MRTALRLLVLGSVVALLCACAAFRVMNPFSGVKAADAEWSGVAGAPVSLAGTLASTATQDPRAPGAVALLELAGAQDALGVLLPVTPVGETSPLWVLCSGPWAAKCRAILINSRVDFAGAPLGPGLVWLPKRLKAS